MQSNNHIFTTLLVIAFVFLFGSNAQAQKYDKAGIKAAIVKAGIPESSITQDVVDMFYNFCLESMDNEDKFEQTILPQLKADYDKKIADEATRVKEEQAVADSLEFLKYCTAEWYQHPNFKKILDQYFDESLKGMSHNIANHFYEKKQYKRDTNCEVCMRTRDFIDQQLKHIFISMIDEEISKIPQHESLGFNSVLSLFLGLGDPNSFQRYYPKVSENPRILYDIIKGAHIMGFDLKSIEHNGIGLFKDLNSIRNEEQEYEEFQKKELEYKKELDDICAPYITALKDKKMTTSQAYEIIKEGTAAILEHMYNAYKQNVYDYFRIRERGEVTRIIIPLTRSGRDYECQRTKIDSMTVENGKITKWNHRISLCCSGIDGIDESTIYKFMKPEQAEDLRMLLNDYLFSSPQYKRHFDEFYACVDSLGNISYKNKYGFQFVPATNVIKYGYSDAVNDDIEDYINWLCIYKNYNFSFHEFNFNSYYDNGVVIGPSGNKYPLKDCIPVIFYDIINNDSDYRAYTSKQKKQAEIQEKAELEAYAEKVDMAMTANSYKCKANNYIGLNSTNIQIFVNRGYVKILANKNVGGYQQLTIRNKWGAKATIKIRLSDGKVVSQR